MKKMILALMAAAGFAFSAGAQAGSPTFSLSDLNGFQVATASAELVCASKHGDKKSSSRDFVAKSGNFSLNLMGQTQNQTLNQILANNPNFSNSDDLPCTAAVAEVQRYVAAAFVYNIVTSFGDGEGLDNILSGVVGVIATRLITATPTVTHLDDDKVLYNWVVALPNWSDFFTPGSDS